MVRDALRGTVQKHAPALMAERARQYEQGLRHRQGITDMARQLEPVVQAGPFTGMRYPPNRLAEVNAPVAKLLGVYELEIADVFQRDYPRFVDVGCADGYYVTGMARRGVPSTGFDIAKSARSLCDAVARANHVDVTIEKRFGLDEAQTVGDGLLLVDIEGAELDLLTPTLIAALPRARVIIEVHDNFHPGLGDHLTSLFARSHAVRRIEQQPRSTPPALEGWAQDDIDMALTEHRPSLVSWLDCVPLTGRY